MNKNIKEILSLRSIIFWLGGLCFVALGIACCTKANLGLSMIAAGPFIISEYLKNFFSWFSQGTAEYFWQAIILIVTCIIVFRFRWRYLLSFLVAVISGFVLDFWLLVLGPVTADGIVWQIVWFILGTLVCGFGVACYFRTKMPLQVYELTVVEIADRYRLDSAKVKLFFDLTMLALCVAMTLIFNHGFRGVGIGTVVTTCINAPVIKMFTKLLDKIENTINKGKTK